MIAINWPLLILTDSPEFPRKSTIAGMVKTCGKEANVINRRFDGNWKILYTRDLPHSNIFLPSKYRLFYLEVNLMPYGFLFYYKKGPQNFVTNVTLYPCECSRQNHLGGRTVEMRHNVIKYDDV